MTRLKAILGSLALVAGVLAPTALAHNDSTQWVFDGLLGPNHPTLPANGADRVSGVYYKDADVLAGHFGPTVAGESTSLMTGIAWVLCDMEVMGDGSAPSPLDEPEVDGVSGGGLGTTLFNDGGIGGVCHRPRDYYAYSPYNTPGCAYDAAYAYDAAAPDVWLSTTCIYGHTSSGGVGLGRYLLACAAHGVRDQDLSNEATCSANTLGCVTSDVRACFGFDRYDDPNNRALCGNHYWVAAEVTYNDCIVEVTLCTVLQDLDACPVVDGFACGPDAAGTADWQTPGQSGWGGTGVAYDSVPAPCENEDGSAIAWVWTAVFVDSFSLDLQVSAPTVGVID